MAKPSSGDKKPLNKLPSSTVAPEAKKSTLPPAQNKAPRKTKTITAQPETSAPSASSPAKPASSPALKPSAVRSVDKLAEAAAEAMGKPAEPPRTQMPALPAPPARKKAAPGRKAPAAKSPPPAPVTVNLASEPVATVRKTSPKPSTRTKKPKPSVSGGSFSGKRVLFVAAECTPLAQTGGLGDMVAGMSKALWKRGHDVRIVMPLYQGIDRAKHGLTFSHSCCVHFGRGEEV